MYCYIHIPFCETKCKYCRFASFSNFSEVQKAFYVDFLCKSIEQSPVKKKPLQSVYFGWGTPSILKISQLKKILICLEKKFWLRKNIEITLESTPQNLKSENIIWWQSLWVNRISTGVQSLNTKTLLEIGRVTKRTIESGLKHAQASPIKNISIDFIIGLPYTKPWDIVKDIASLLEKYSNIQHVSVYMLEEYYYPESWAGVSFSPDLYQEEYSQIRKYLWEQGFSRYELSNFAKKGYECKHNQAYWQHEEMLAFWLDAHGFIQGERYAYPNNFKEYYQGKKNYQETVSKKEKITEQCMFGLRTHWINLKLLKYLDTQKIETCIQAGLLQKTQTHIVINAWGESVLDSILKEILI